MPEARKDHFVDGLAGFIAGRAWWVLLVALLLAILAIVGLGRLNVSTKLEALMPEAAPSVIALNHVLDKTSSFASIQIVARSDDTETTVAYIQAVQNRVEAYPWVSSSQYFEDISNIEKHKLLLANTDELLELEQDLDTHIGSEIAHGIAAASNVPVTIELRENKIRGDSSVPSNGRLDEVVDDIEQNPETTRLFVSKDDFTIALVIWPQPGLTSLGDAKRMVTDSQHVIDTLDMSTYGDNLRAGVAGRIKNKVAQFDSVINDAKTSLGGAVLLIVLLLLISYRRWVAVPCIIVPLLLGLIWTLGITAVTLGTLNLITIFLVLILFGLGIDFGIHNFSRYLEVRNHGDDLVTALSVVIGHTGRASVIAAVTSVLGFLALLLTEFRTFAEFGFIAGMGLAIIFIGMYTVFPALLVVFDRWLSFSANSGAQDMQLQGLQYASKKAQKKIQTVPIFILTGIVLAGAAYIARDITFEKNFKNLEAKSSAEHQWATMESKRVFPDGHDRAIMVLPGWDELHAANAYFNDLIATDHHSPTIDKVSSILDYLPEPSVQKQRLEIIHRLHNRVNEFDSFDPDNAGRARRYVDISELTLAQLPPALIRAYTSSQSDDEYLLYIYNSVSMDDADMAREFYNDAAYIDVNNQSYASASEGFVFVEMIALMKADAIKAIALVVLATILVVLLFFRSFIATFIVLLPPLSGVVLTLAVMVLTGQSLSIINMVVLPALVGIAVDNSIHIYHRFITANGITNGGVNVHQVMHTTGRAALLTTLTTLVSFGGLTTASMGGLRGMGYLAITGFLCCMLFTWFLTPALLTWRLKHLNGRDSYTEVAIQ